MITLFIVLPLAFLVASAAVAAFAWAVRSGQLDDLETPPRRILYDDEPPPDRAPFARAEAPRAAPARAP